MNAMKREDQGHVIPNRLAYCCQDLGRWSEPDVSAFAVAWVLDLQIADGMWVAVRVGLRIVGHDPREHVIAAHYPLKFGIRRAVRVDEPVRGRVEAVRL